MKDGLSRRRRSDDERLAVKIMKTKYFLDMGEHTCETCGMPPTLSRRSDYELLAMTSIKDRSEV